MPIHYTYPIMPALSLQLFIMASKLKENVLWRKIRFLYKSPNRLVERLLKLIK